MKVLILGGTGFLGRHVVALCLKHEHRVTVFSRGYTNAILPRNVERIHGDRDEGLEGLLALGGGHWDVCIDMSGYTAKHVHYSATFLSSRVAHYVFVSAIRVFLPKHNGPINETCPKHLPADKNITDINSETYGRLKVASELIVSKLYAGRSTIVRPQVMVGPDDPSGRMAYWLMKAKSDDLILLPGDGLDVLQVVDVIDVSQFILSVIERKVFGDFNLAGHSVTWQAFAQLLNVKMADWVPAEKLQAMNLSFRELPLYRPRLTMGASYMNVANSKAAASGFKVSDFSQTLSRVSCWFESSPLDEVFPDGLQDEFLSRKKELELLNAASV